LEVNARANRLAHYLIQLGIRPEAPLGVFALRSPQTLISLLAILKAGAAYVPLDPGYPSERTQFYLEDAGITLILADPQELSRLPATSAKIVLLREDLARDQPESNPPHRSGPHSLAYIVYTSGSTGQPKGVLIEHQGVLRLTRNMEYMVMGPGETCLQNSTLLFDAATFEIWTTWLNGGTLALPSAGPGSLHELDVFLRSFGVSTLFLTADLFHLIVDQKIEALAGVRQLLTGGDVVSPVHAERFLRRFPEARLINAYGPTENSVFTSCQVIRLEEPMPARLPIGRPLDQTGVLVLDVNLQPVAPGEVGELILTGDGVARGYLNRPELTEKSFVQVTEASGRTVRGYRSGDLGCYHADGTLEFRGRLDRQVKIHGLRIELDEIKLNLLEHPQVANAEVLLVDHSETKHIEAFVVPRPGSDLAENSLRDFLRRKLPENWIPARLRMVRTLPLTANGKVDRKALLENSSPVLADEQPVPEEESYDPLEKVILNIWRDVLPGTLIRKDDNFFDLGGDSLSAMNMLAQVEKMTGRDVGLRPLLEGGTIASIASAALETGPIAPPPLLICTQAGTTKPPFIFAHGDYTAGGLFCQKLAQKLGPDRPFYSITPPGTYSDDWPSSIGEIAALNLDMIRSIQPRGPYHLGGFCNGAMAMYEAAQQLIRAGETVATLVLLDPPDMFFPLRGWLAGWLDKWAGWSERQSKADFGIFSETAFNYKYQRGSIGRRNPHLRWPMKHLFRLGHPPRIEPNLNRHYLALVTSHQPRPYLGTGPVSILLRKDEHYRHADQIRFWSRLIRDVRFDVVMGSHLDFRSSLGEIAGKIQDALEKKIPDQP
jgi:amino acid adenylation domain-containing protein